MDSATLHLHRGLLRLAKGALTTYECWITAQAENALQESLNALRTERAKPAVDTKGKEG